ncbi:unnamed protein product [Linum trigynum]|uniref:Uncharacterized protein n=2 Tax=Linum trigynum TaxID=586398 RepID=A0AAV2ELS8_9ROSI
MCPSCSLGLETWHFLVDLFLCVISKYWKLQWLHSMLVSIRDWVLYPFLPQMATKPLTHEEIANTEKKLDMPLDDIIKMSKTSTAKPNKQRRAPNKNQRMFNNSAQEKALKVQKYMASRPFVRQGALAQRRSNFQGNHFPIAKDIAQKAAVAPLRNRPFERNLMSNPNKAREGSFMVRRGENGAFTAKPPQSQQQYGNGGMKQRPQTLDAMFANMKEQRMRALVQQNNAVRHNNGLQQQNNAARPNNSARQNNGARQNNNNWGQRNRNTSRIGVPWARNHFS